MLLQRRTSVLAELAVGPELTRRPCALRRQRGAQLLLVPGAAFGAVDILGRAASTREPSSCDAAAKRTPGMLAVRGSTCTAASQLSGVPEQLAQALDTVQ